MEIDGISAEAPRAHVDVGGISTVRAALTCAARPSLGPGASAPHGMLSHNHLLLVLLSWLNGAEWKLTEEERQVLATGADGRLDVEAAVAVKNLQELHKTCREGLLVEVVSWKIVVELPGACTLISNALNVSSSIALRTTELTALSVLSGNVDCIAMRSTLTPWISRS